MLRSAAIALALGFLPLIFSSPSAAEPASSPPAERPARVVIVPAGAGDLVAARLIDELIASGVTVEVTTATNEAEDENLLDGGARAVMRVLPSRRAVRVWTADQAQGTRESVFEAEPGAAETSARELALRVVEALRPYFSKAPPSAPTEAPPAAPSIPESAKSPKAPSPVQKISEKSTTQGPIEPSRDAPPDDITIYVAPALVLRPATPLSPGGGGLWGFTKMLTPYFGLDLSVIVPVVPAELSTPDGHVKIASGSIGGSVMFRYPTTPSTFRGWIGAGIAAGFAGYDAEATSTAVRATDGIVAHAPPSARLALEWRPWSAIGFRVDFLASIARPRPVLEVSGRPDTPLEEPLLGIATGLFVWLP